MSEMPCVAGRPNASFQTVYRDSRQPASSPASGFGTTCRRPSRRSGCATGRLAARFPDAETTPSRWAAAIHEADVVFAPGGGSGCRVRCRFPARPDADRPAFRGAIWAGGRQGAPRIYRHADLPRHEPAGANTSRADSDQMSWSAASKSAGLFTVGPQVWRCPCSACPGTGQPRKIRQRLLYALLRWDCSPRETVRDRLDVVHDPQRDLADTIGAVYAAAAGDGSWHAAGARLRALLGAQLGSIRLPEGTGLGPNILGDTDPWAAKAYAAYYHAVDPYRARAGAPSRARGCRSCGGR